MECEDARLLQQWVANWGELIDFEIVPVVPSKETSEWLLQQLGDEKDA